MSADLEKAKKILREGGFTCAAARGDVAYTSAERGVKPLVAWLDDGISLKGFSAADKVVGRAAAFLYVLSGVKEVYADVLGKGALEIFSRYAIPVFCGATAEKIVNRAGDGLCPMEAAVSSVVTPEEALAAVRAKTEELALKSAARS